MAHAAGLLAPAARTPVFVIDRAADSVGHSRKWQRAGRLFLVRADDAPRAEHEGEHRPLGEAADLLKRRGGGAAFADARPVLFRGLPRPGSSWPRRRR